MSKLVPPRRQSPKSIVQSLAKGFRILEAFSGVRPEMTLSEIAAVTGHDPGTTHRMLKTLVALGYVTPILGSRRFGLTLKILDLGFHAIGRNDLRSTVRPVLRSLVGETSEAASFGVIEGGNLVFIDRVRAGQTQLGVDIRVGTSVPAPFSVIGIAILAFLPKDAFKRVMTEAQKLPKPAIAGIKRTKLVSMLDGVRRQGYILHDSLTSDGLRILAVPVRASDGYPIGAISVAAPMFRTSADELKIRSLDLLRTAAAEIARAMEASGSAN